MSAPTARSDEVTLAVLSTQLEHLAQTVEKIQTTLATSGTTHVTRAEWQMRNETVDARFADLNRRTDQAEQKRAPWWAVASLIVAGASVAWLILGPAIIAL